MVICKSKKIYSLIKSNKAFGIDKDIKDRKSPGMYNVNSLGLNFRITDFQACLGYQQLKRYPNELKSRKKNAKLYSKFLSEFKEIKFHNYLENASYFIFPIFLKKKNKQKVMKMFKKNKIGFSVHYGRPVNLLNYYKKNNKLCPNSKIFSEETISLPVHSGIDKKKITYIIKIMKMALK